MSLALNSTLRWTDANESETAALRDIQGNILDGHGRKATLHVFLRFGADPAASRAFIRELAPLITSALKQLTEFSGSRRKRRAVHRPASLVFRISAAGSGREGTKAR